MASYTLYAGLLNLDALPDGMSDNARFAFAIHEFNSGNCAGVFFIKRKVITEPISLPSFFIIEGRRSELFIDINDQGANAFTCERRNEVYATRQIFKSLTIRVKSALNAVFDAQNGSRQHWEDCIIDGGKDREAQLGIIQGLGDDERLRSVGNEVINCTIKRFQNAGIWFNNCGHNNSISKTSISECGYGISGKCETLRIDHDSAIEQNDFAAIALQDGTRLTVLDSYFEWSEIILKSVNIATFHRNKLTGGKVRAENVNFIDLSFNRLQNDAIEIVGDKYPALKAEGNQVLKLEKFEKMISEYKGEKKIMGNTYF